MLFRVVSLQAAPHSRAASPRGRRRAFPSPQLLFLAGMTLTIGVQATLQFFTRRRNRQARMPPNHGRAAAAAPLRNEHAGSW
jgi:hypothetical protein